MTTLREAAQQALEAIRIFREWEMGQDYHSNRDTVLARAFAAEETLEAALAEPVQEPVWVCPDSAEHRYGKPGHCEDCGKTLVQVAEPVQEPVAWMDIDENGNRLTVRQWSDGNREEVPLYTAPPQRKPLTEIGDSNG